MARASRGPAPRRSHESGGDGGDEVDRHRPTERGQAEGRAGDRERAGAAHVPGAYQRQRGGDDQRQIERLLPHLAEADDVRPPAGVEQAADQAGLTRVQPRAEADDQRDGQCVQHGQADEGVEGIAREARERRQVEREERRQGVDAAAPGIGHGVVGPAERARLDQPRTLGEVAVGVVPDEAGAEQVDQAGEPQGQGQRDQAADGEPGPAGRAGVDGRCGSEEGSRDRGTVSGQGSPIVVTRPTRFKVAVPRPVRVSRSALKPGVFLLQ
jgi:hypothetical protein